MRMDCDPNGHTTSRGGQGCIVTTFLTSVNANASHIRIQTVRVEWCFPLISDTHLSAPSSLTEKKIQICFLTVFQQHNLDTYVC